MECKTNVHPIQDTAEVDLIFTQFTELLSHEPLNMMISLVKKILYHAKDKNDHELRAHEHLPIQNQDDYNEGTTYN